MPSLARIPFPGCRSPAAAAPARRAAPHLAVFAAVVNPSMSPAFEKDGDDVAECAQGYAPAFQVAPRRLDGPRTGCEWLDRESHRDQPDLSLRTGAALPAGTRPRMHDS